MSDLDLLNFESTLALATASAPETTHSLKKMAPKYRIRRMRPDDVDAVLEIWGQNNLHEGTHTIQSFMAVDPDGFVVAVEIRDSNPEMSTDGGDCKDSGKSQLATLQSGSNTSKDCSNINLDHHNRKFHQSQHHSQSTNDPTIPNLTSSPSSSSTSNVTPKMIADCCYKIVSNSLDRINLSKVCKSAECWQEGNILGMCCGVFVHPTIAFIGMYAVRPELHGCGIGIAMWNRMMEHVNGGNAGLYAVLEHMEMYRDRAGFKVPDNRQLMIYETDGPPPNSQLLVKQINGIQLCSIHGDHAGSEFWWDSVIEYDAHVHGYSREKLLKNVFREPNSAAFAAIDESVLNLGSDSDCGGECAVQGYGCIRTNNIGKAMIGPLYAMNDAVAELLMRRLFEALSKPFSLGLLYMTLDQNPGGEAIANKIGLPKHEELPCFFRVEPHRKVQWNQVYCIHTPNFSLL